MGKTRLQAQWNSFEITYTKLTIFCVDASENKYVKSPTLLKQEKCINKL